MKKVCALLLALILVMSLVACGGGSTNSLTNQFVGKWEDGNGKVVEFFKDGSCDFSTEKKDYVLFTPYENEKIAFTFQYENWQTKQTSIEFFSYSFEGDTLTINNTTYKKQ